MPYKSDAQRRKFHAMESRGEISKKTVDEYDKASKGKKLPARAKKKRKLGIHESAKSENRGYKGGY